MIISEILRDFLNNNRDKLMDMAVSIENLPADDDWIQDGEWDEIYEKEGLKDGKV